MAKVTASQFTELTIDEQDSTWGRNGPVGRRGALIGGLAALNTENEWHYANGILYFKPPSGVDPNNLNIQVKNRLRVVNISGNYIQLQDIDFFAGQVVLQGNHNVLDNVRVYYGAHFVYQAFPSDSLANERSGGNSVFMGGDFNTVKNSEVAFSAGSGIIMTGIPIAGTPGHEPGNENEVRNCLIHDFGYMGVYSSGILFNGNHNSLTYSTLFNSGRDILMLGGTTSNCTACTIKYNYLYNSTLLANDSGVVYSYSRDLFDTEIAYNWLQANTIERRKEPDLQRLFLGIYFDSGSRNAVAHHNLIRNLWDDV